MGSEGNRMRGKGEKRKGREQERRKEEKKGGGQIRRVGRREVGKGTGREGGK